MRLPLLTEYIQSPLKPSCVWKLYPAGTDHLSVRFHDLKLMLWDNPASSFSLPRWWVATNFTAVCFVDSGQHEGVFTLPNCWVGRANNDYIVEADEKVKGKHV